MRVFMLLQTFPAGALSLGYDREASATNIREQALEQQQRALHNFLGEVEKRAFRLARIATNDTDEALDIVQDAMFKLVQKYGDREQGEWPPLFHTILQSRIRDWYRRNRVRRGIFALMPGNWQDESGVDPIQQAKDRHGQEPARQLQGEQSMEALDQALHALPLRQQQAFLLRAWEGLDVRQTAGAMGCSEGSVKTHYSRAVHRLRASLSEHWGE